MSLVSTYVEASDGLFYNQPILSGEGWYVCWDDDDPIELIVDMSQCKNKQEAVDALMIVIQHLTKNDFVIMPEKYAGNFRWGERLYPPKWNKFKKSISVFVEQLMGKVPAELITKHDGTVEKDPKTGGPLGKNDCVYYKALS